MERLSLSNGTAKASWWAWTTCCIVVALVQIAGMGALLFLGNDLFVLELFGLQGLVAYSSSLVAWSLCVFLTVLSYNWFFMLRTGFADAAGSFRGHYSPTTLAVSTQGFSLHRALEDLCECC